MKKYIAAASLLFLFCDSSSTQAVPKEKLIDSHNDLRRAEEFVSAGHVKETVGTEYFLQERLKEINRLRLVLAEKANTPEGHLAQTDVLSQEEDKRGQRTKDRMSGDIKALSLKGEASVEAYGKDFIKYKDGKVLRIKKGLIVSVENEKVYDKRGNKYIKDTKDIQYDDLKRIISYREETLSPDGKTRTVLTKTNTAYYLEEDTENNYRRLEGMPGSFTEVQEVYNVETGGLISSSKKDWSDILYYSEEDSKARSDYAYKQMSSYTVTEYVNANSNAIGAVTKTADIKYVHSLKYINELTIGGEVSDSALTDEERYEYLVTGYRENYKPQRFSGSEQTTVLENIKYNNYGEFYSYKQKVQKDGYTLTRIVDSIEYDASGNIVTVVDTTNISFDSTALFEQFARKYSTDDLFSDTAVQNEFIEEYLTAEGAFHEAGISYSELNGMTFDSYALNPETGGAKGTPNAWSAPSNESLHIQILAAAIAGNTNAAIFVSPDDPSKAAEIALSILEKKMATLEQFYTANPKYAGFLPWFVHSGDVITPSEDWFFKVPALDNGQLAWALIMTYKVLLDVGQDALAERYRVYWQRMANNAKTVFWDGAGVNRIRGEATIADLGGGVFSYTNATPAYTLSDPYEGEIMALFMSLFSTLTAGEVTALWANKSMTSSTYTTSDGDNITVRTGHWYSSHEMWNFFVLPYTDDALVAEVFRLGEIARTAYSAENGIPGLYASVNPPEGSVPAGVSYASACGIASLANNAIDYPNIITPYAAFPVLLADKGAGLSWLANMLQGAKAQGPYGTTESMTVDGTSIANVLSWDSKAILVNSLISDTIHSTLRTVMQDKGVYADFLGLINTEYTDTFTNLASLQGSQLSMFKPSTPLPRPAGVSDFMDTPNRLVGVDVSGNGRLNEYSTFDSEKGELYLADEEGFVFAHVDPVDLAKDGVISFSVWTTKATDVWVELKNDDNQIITSKAVRLFFDNTRGSVKTFSIDVSGMLNTSDTFLHTITFLDPSAALDIKSVFVNSGLAGMNYLRYDSVASNFMRSRSIINSSHEQELYVPAQRVNAYLSDLGGYKPRAIQEIKDILVEAESLKSIPLGETGLPSSYVKKIKDISSRDDVKEAFATNADDFDEELNNSINTAKQKILKVYDKAKSKSVKNN